MNLIELKQVSYVYPGTKTTIFHGVDLRIGSGEIVGLSGSSGVGKSTLADIILGLLRPAGGRVLWNTKDIASLKSQELFRQRRYYQKIFQDPAVSFPPHQTTGKAIRDLAKRYRITLKQNEIAERFLEPLGLPVAVLDRYPHQMSGGEMQRIALARIMLIKPRFVVADEPTSMLDVSVQAEVARLLEQLARQEKWGLFFISHDADLLHSICDREVGLVHDKKAGARLATRM